MIFLRRTNGCTKSYSFQNEDIKEEQQIFSMNGKIKEYQDKWFQHVNRIKDTRLPYLVFNYKARRKKKDIGHPKQMMA